MNSTLTIHIKNMVCNRCIKIVKDEIEKLNIKINEIKLGIVNISEQLNPEQLLALKRVLEQNGFELIDDKKSQIIDRIKTIIIEQIHHSKEIESSIVFSKYISGKIGYDYSYLSKLFSSEESITIEKYIILQKIERAKELLVYNELSIKEISYTLGYSSIQHLSNQFKKITGLTPTHFKSLNENKRKPLDKV
ncbi:MAG: helix-turn-helix transcriptional regulator [Bacteroidales bacterium]|nr:helix-turn-helix transcriptional regulator [Bacteroidales bacterium]